jgi:mono/diheme cytochrome c family protein
MKFVKIVSIAFCVLIVTTGCTMNMRDQPRRDPLQTSSFFEDGRSARPLEENTIPRGYLTVNDPHFYTGFTEDGKLAETFPIPIDRAVLERGHERYNIFCSPCHGLTGDGRGVVVQRGMTQPNSFHDKIVRSQPPGHFFNAMTVGFGAGMYSYASRIPPKDRWAIAAYIKVLQFSQDATVDDVPADKMQELEAETSQ